MKCQFYIFMTSKIVKIDIHQFFAYNNMNIENDYDDYIDFTKRHLIFIVTVERQEDEPPPEPAPPEIPPRAQSLLASIKKLSSHTIKIDDSGDLKHEEFIPQSQQQGN